MTNTELKTKLDNQPEIGADVELYKTNSILVKNYWKLPSWAQIRITNEIEAVYKSKDFGKMGRVFDIVDESVQKADTRKTTSLLKKYLQNKYGVKFSVKTEKFSMGSSININYVCGPNSKDLDIELAGLCYGSFNGMEDIYEHNHIDPMVIDGYELQQYKYIHISQEIPKEIKTEVAIKLAAIYNFADVEQPTCYDDLHKRYNFAQQANWTWSEFMHREISKWEFCTDDFENIEILSVYRDEENSFNHIIEYRYNDKIYNSNNKLNTTEMKKVELKVGQEVKVTNKDNASETGIITKVNEKSIKYNVNGAEKLVMLANNTVEVLKDVEAKADTKADAKADKPAEKPAETKKADADKSSAKDVTVKTSPDTNLYEFIISIASVVTFPENELEKVKTLELTAKGQKTLNKLAVDYKAGKYEKDVKAMVAKLGEIAKTMVKKAKAQTEAKAENKAEKAQPELHPSIELLTKVTDEKSFDEAKKKITADKVDIISKKNKKVYTLDTFENGNIYVTDGEKRYYCMPSRFGHHFAVK